MKEENIIYEKRDTWQYGKSPGFYDVLKDEIHILDSEETFYGTLIHERFHRSRRGTPTFLFATLIAMPIFVYAMFAIIGLSAFLAVFTLNSVPLLTSLGLFLALIGCHTYEEKLADRAVKKAFEVKKP